MEWVAIGLVVVIVLRFGIYGRLEVSLWRYGLLKAMASQSQEVDRALQTLLREKGDCKVTNGEFTSLERVYIRHLNRYLIERGHVDDTALRRELLTNETFEP